VTFRARLLLAGSLIAAAAGAQAPQEEPPSSLEQGHVRERAIVGGERHRYTVRLMRSQYVDASIGPQGVTVTFRLVSPGGKELFTETLPGGTGPKSIEWIAEEEGEHALEVQATSVETVHGRYRLELRTLRAAQPIDRTRFAARMALEDGEKVAVQDDARALESFDRALSLAQEIGDPDLEGRILDRIGRAHTRRVNLDEAAEALAQAYERRQALGSYLKGDTLISLASLARARRDHQQALRYFREAQALMRKAGVRVNEALAFQGMGSAYFDLGVYADAEETFRITARIYAEEGLAEQQAVALSSLARVYWQLRKPDEALAVNRELEEIRKRVGTDGKRAEAKSDLGLTYCLLANVKEQPEHYQTAIKYLDEALAVQERLEDPRQRATLQRLRRVYEDRGDWEKALEYSRRVLEFSAGPSSRARGTDWLELNAQARIESKRGRLPEARALIEKALTSLETYRPRVSDQDLRAFYEGSVNHLFDLQVDILMRLHERDPAAGLDHLAFQASERGRARALLDSLGEQRAGAPAEADPALIRRQQELQQAAADLRSRLAEKAREKQKGRRGGPKGNGKEDPARGAELRGVLMELSEVDKRRIERQDSLRRVEPADLAQVRSLLDDQSLVLEYDLGPERSYAWAITKESWTSFVLPKEEELEGIARSLPELLAAWGKPDTRAGLAGLKAHRANVQKEFDEKAARLSELILGPVPVKPEVSRLIFVWDGALNYVPVAGLPLPKGWPGGREGKAAPRGSGSTPLLISRYEIVTLPSVSVGAALERARAVRQPAPKQVAVFADPVFGPSDERLRGLTLPPPDAPATEKAPGSGKLRPGLGGTTMSGAELVRLPYTAKLAAETLKLVPRGEGLAALGFDANRDAVFSPALADYRMIVFNTHSVFDAEFPAFSGIVLSLFDAKGNPREGFLRQHEVYGLRLNADLVVLAGCETAMGNEIRGEGLVGLSRGFLYAGTGRVAASLWKVEETATVELVIGVLKRVKEGKSYAAALRESQLAMARDPRWHAPYYWAAFVMQGDWH
jgi:CHAT domain-containing protein/tetratricopeptide (TPR) repeat protein